MSFAEAYSPQKPSPKYMIPIAAWLILVTGFRDAGPDYGSYKNIYIWYSSHIDYIDIFRKALKMDSRLDMEWLFILINKVIFDIFAAPPFFIVTFFLALISIPLNYINIRENSLYPYTTILLFFFPSFFIGENGQMRQALGTIICYYSIRFIKEEKVWHYLFCIYLAMGIHNVCLFFLPMYWLARIPINKTVMATAIIGSMILSPFEIYKYMGSFLPDESSLMSGFNNYINMNNTAERLNGAIGIPEGNAILSCLFLFVFDTDMKKKYPYYEYMRNFCVLGICFFFIFRGSIMFSSRLTGIFFTATGYLMPYAMYSANAASRRMIHTVIVCYCLFNFIIFSSFNTIVRGRFTIDTYTNFLLP
ncbi:EpsG family protein [uncultured Chryseobacterium sp.]|uniref:EpsG family protein n=1 Tax=uncultured Chryseobacterium sp. TaxID=259322 RepID=UPI0025E04B85|nr:EpsG family protein [uncultured Chryseobacterium sp.]